MCSTAACLGANRLETAIHDVGVYVAQRGMKKRFGKAPHDFEIEALPQMHGALEDALALADAIRDAKEKIRACSTCHNITESDPCYYCVGPTRSKKTICVVEEAHNIMAVEKTRTYNGMYHVLGGSLSPLSGRGPEQLHIKSLIERLKAGIVEEIIIATNPTAEGEATAVYLSKLLKPLGVRVTRIGVGVPVGADLEYADEVTMLKAMEGRREL